MIALTKAIVESLLPPAIATVIDHGRGHYKCSSPVPTGYFYMKEAVADGSGPRNRLRQGAGLMYDDSRHNGHEECSLSARLLRKAGGTMLRD